jgi:hypothetical protein
MAVPFNSMKSYMNYMDVPTRDSRDKKIGGGRGVPPDSVHIALELKMLPEERSDRA